MNRLPIDSSQRYEWVGQPAIIGLSLELPRRSLRAALLAAMVPLRRGLENVLLEIGEIAEYFLRLLYPRG